MSAGLAVTRWEHFVRRQRRLGSSELAGEKKPPFGGGNEALAVAPVALRLRQLLFGYRSTLDRCEHRAPQPPPGRS